MSCSSRRRVSRRASTVACALAAALVATAAATAAVAQERTYRFDLPRQSLSKALRAYGQASGQQIVFTDALVAERTAPAVRGDLTAQQALDRLLANSGLTARRNAAGVLMVEPAQRPVSELAPGPEEASVVEEVVVTGSNIRGVRNPTAPTEVFDRDRIARRGFGTTQEFIRSLPQNFKGGPEGGSEDGVLVGANGLSNAAGASGVNLRGLGVSSTLVLLNGHRIAPSAVGAVADVSLFPLAAIDRVEVLTDGASAVYGSDAVGGVVNFVLRQDYDGDETGVRLSSVTEGSRREYQVDHTSGRAWSGGNVVGVVRYAKSDRLPATDRSFTRDIDQPTDIYPETEQWSLLLTGRQQLLPSLELFGDALYSRSETTRFTTQPAPSGTQFDEFLTRFHSANVGLRWNPFADWRVEGMWLDSEVDAVLRQPFNDFPQPGYVPGSVYLEQDFRLSEGTLKADGSILRLPAGAMKIALGVSRRNEDFTHAADWASVRRRFERTVEATFAEIYAPLVGPEAQVPLMRRLDLSAAIRHDRYSDFGETTNPKVGLYWSPIEGLGVRGSWGTSFRTPTASEIMINAANLNIFNYPYAAPGGGTTTVFVLGGNPVLRPESSESWTFGLEFEPRFLPRTRFTLNVFDTTYKDRLITPPFDLSALLKPEVYGPLITPLASDAAAAAFLAGLQAQGFQFYDVTGTGSAGIRHVVNLGLTNASAVRQTGFDIAASWAFDLGDSTFDIQLNTTVINQIDTAFCDGCVSTDIVNTYGQPLKFRLRGDLGWTRGAWRVNGAVNHANAYDDTLAVPRGRIDAYTTLDLNAVWSPPWLGGGSVSLAVTNLLDAEPPKTARSVGFASLRYDGANADPIGRVVALSLRKRW